MPTDALADLQFDFFLPDSLSGELWVAAEVRAFSVDADRVLTSRGGSVLSESSSFDVDNSLMDSSRAPSTDTPHTARQSHTTSGREQLGVTSASRDEHLLPGLRDHHWGSDEDSYGLQVDQPTAYHDDVISVTQHDNKSHQILSNTTIRHPLHHHQPSTWSEMHITTNTPWTSSSASTRGTTVPTTSASGRGRRRQIHPPLTMHYADYVRQISSSLSRHITTTTPPSTTRTTTSVRRRTGGASRSGVTRPSSRRASMTTGGRRTPASNGSAECGRRCPRFRPGVRRQFCTAQFGESATVVFILVINVLVDFVRVGN